MLTLDNGAKPLLIAGTPDTGIVLADWQSEYVVWAYVKDGEKYHTAWGDYFDYLSLSSAEKYFRRRAARELGIETK